MADIRINALAGTATSAASDDYLALDGAANGTRKILASNIAQNVSDVVLGTNGPSVKSSLDARAARQGLVFAGTSGASVSVPAFGTADFTVHAIVNPASVASQQAIVAAAPNTGFNLYVLAGGVVRAQSGNAAQFTDSTTALTAGKTAAITVVRSSGTTTIYINAISDASKADTYNYNNAIDSVGQYNSGQFFNGAIGGVAIYNRALSASEVVSLFEAGVPSGADYNTASNTSISTAALSSFPLFTAYSTFASANGTTFSAQDANPFRACGTNASFNVTVGQKILVTFTFTQLGSDLPQVLLCSTGGTDSSNAAFAVVGSNSILLTATRTDTVRVRFFSFNAANYSVTNLAVTRQGLLLAPDAAQAGGGLTWYDTSGNAANITLPASGVSWNVPTSGNVTSGGNVTLAPATGYKTYTAKTIQSQIGTGATSAANVEANSALITQAAGGSLGLFFSHDTTANRPLIQSITGGTAFSMLLNPYGGNLLLGTTTDSSNGKLQLATHTTSAGGIGFGTDTSFFRSAAGNLQLSASVTSAAIAINNVGSGVAALAYDATGALVYSTGSLRFQTNSGTTALTLDSSQNATFAGRIGLTASGSNTIYSNFIPADGGTFAGRIVMQAGGGSSAYGGGVAMYGPSHTTKPGWISLGISATTGAKFAVNSYGTSDGTDLFTIDAFANQFINNTASVPSSNPVGGGYLYVQGGALKYRGSSGTVTTIANA